MKFILMAIAVCLLTGCLEPIATFFGADTPAGEPSPATALFGTAGAWLPGGLGLGLVALAKMAHSSIRVKNALFESTKQVIASGDLTNAKTAKEVKKAFKDAQSIHVNSKALAKAYATYKDGGFIKSALKKVKKFIPFISKK